MATQIGVSMISQPTPSWYVKLEKAFLLGIIPAGTVLVQSLGLTDAQANKFLVGIAFAGTLIKGIGVLLGDPDPTITTTIAPPVKTTN